MNIRKVLIILFFLLISQKVKSQEAEQKKKDTTKIEPSPKNQKFSRKNLLAYIKEIKIQYPLIVFRQGVHESGFFKSKIYKENNNVFGMRKPVRRTTTAIGTNRGYAKYRSWKESVVDYLLFQNRFIYKINNQQQYLNYLDNNYSAIGREYSRRLMKIDLGFIFLQE